MSLGGYKFAGRYCQKGSLTDAQWALKMHKTKVAAFMAANTLSGAGWEYDMTGSPDGNYHCLDSVGNNYVTVFKRTNGTDDYTWFAIYTLTKFTWSGTDSGAVKMYLIYSGLYVGYNASSFYRIGTSAISYSDDLSQAPSNLQSKTGLMPIGNPGASSSDISSSYYPPNDSSFRDGTIVRFGFAVKSDSVIMFQGWSTDYSARYTACSIASGHGFSSFVNSDDSSGLFAYNTQMERTGSYNYELETREVSNSNMSSDICVAINGGSNAPVYTAKLFVAPFMAAYNTSIENYPFQAISVSQIGNTVTNVVGKGTLSVDFISINFPGANQNLVPAMYQSFANGKYLCVNYITGGYYYSIKPLNSQSNIEYDAAMYVGWDPANPDITQASSWTEYTD